MFIPADEFPIHDQSVHLTHQLFGCTWLAGKSLINSGNIIGKNRENYRKSTGNGSSF
jgi:hypothetical protein